MGLATFGPMHSQPSQPLDAGVPVCNAKLAADETHNLDRYDRSNIESDNSVDKCMSAKLSDDSDKLILEVKDCSTQLPVMCFNFGQFILAKDLNSNNSDDLSRKTFDEAFQRCFETGREIANKAQLDSYVTGGPITAPVVNGKYEFINLAQQGMFLAPQTARDIESYREWLSENSITDNPEFWIALKPQNGFPNSVPPKIVASNQDAHALYFSELGRLVYKKFNGPVGVNTGGSNQALMLVHNIKFKGAIKANTNQGSTQYNFLCMRANGEVFKSNSGSSNFSDGTAKCNASGGLFLPPTTPAGWAKAFALAAPFAPNYAFPDPESAGGAIWIAYQEDAGGNWDLPTDFYNFSPAYLPLKLSEPAIGAGLKADGSNAGGATKKLCLEQDKFVVIDGSSDCSDGSRKIEADQLKTSPAAKVFYIRWRESGSADSNAEVKLVGVN